MPLDLNRAIQSTQNLPLADDDDFMFSADTTGVNLGSEQSTVHKFLMIFAFGEEADEAQCCTKAERLAADNSWKEKKKKRNIL